MGKIKKILLIGNPNVGKSALFYRLTGIYVVTSNYPGTTVEFTKGYITINGDSIEVIDVPGTYTIEIPDPKKEPDASQGLLPAEEVAIKMLDSAIASNDTVVIQVIDATNLERNLNLTLQLIKKNIPMIIALNFWDEAKHRGIIIDVTRLETLLGVPVIPTVAITGEGIKELKEKIKDAKLSAYKYELGERWLKIGEIISCVQKITHRHHSFTDRLGEITIKPATGLPIAILILYLTFAIVRLVGETLTNYILDPFFTAVYLPKIITLITSLNLPKLISELLLGTTPEPLKSFGILTTGLYIPFVVVLPYLFSFYLVLSILEDIGYLPRLATLLDIIFHRLGVHGYSSIPVILGLGCKVPAILATRILETDRERVITTALIMMSAPCMPQTAMVISILSPYGNKYIFLFFFILIFFAIFASFLINKIMKGETPELFVEIPPYRKPCVSILIRKLWLRLFSFIMEAIPLIIVGVFIAGLLEVTGIANLLARYLGNFVISLLGLPPETTSVLLIGFLRKDISIALLKPFVLTPKQLLIASIFLVLYLPCMATFFIMVKELGLRNSLKIVMILLVSGFAVSNILSLVL